MEPRPIERGNKGLILDETTPEQGFNGATPNRAWKHYWRERYARQKAELQWSHAQSSVETLDSVAERFKSGEASMEPRPIERGNPRRHGSPARGGRASMEPRPIERGNHHSARRVALCDLLQWSHAQSSVETFLFVVCCLCNFPLQWSHAQSSVETLEAENIPERINDASMEPRPIERGNNGDRSRRVIAERASMEPRPIERGNTSVFIVYVSLLVASMEPRPIERGNRVLSGREDVWA